MKTILRLIRKMRRTPLQQYVIDQKKEQAQGATLNHNQNVFTQMKGEQS